MAPRSQKLTFRGSTGATLAARLERPAGPARAFALFAHCFTCSKDSLAATRISTALAAHGIATLRFDFTGLGASQGDFANTDFSSNVQDLLAAAEHLRAHERAPELLIGHSLGGAAVLAAAPDIPEARAVATIGAPADADHVVRSFHARRAQIEREGQAQVELAGRRFTITRQFLADLEGQSVRARVREMRKALLIFHSPRDEVVGIDNASALFQAARHPKSFISLDGADHLLRSRADGDYVAAVLAAWAARYVPALAERAGEAAGRSATAPAEPGWVRVVETGEGRFQQSVAVGAHRLLADEPVDLGGGDTGPSPYDYLSIALGACTSMTLRMYADHKGLALEGVAVEVGHEKVHAQDCRDCGEEVRGREGRIDRFERRIALEGALSDKERQRLLEIADRCPVHRTLTRSAVIVTYPKKGQGQ